MASYLSLPNVSYRQLPPLFYASLGALAGLLITAFVLSERAEQKKLELMSDLGETVVQMSSRELMEATVNEDLISMQAILQSLVAQPRIVMATVHNLEQQLLVQAGHEDGLVQYQSFSAPITAHNRIEGYVSISLENQFPGDSAVRWTLSATATLLFLMIVLTLYESRGKAWYFVSANEDAEPDDLQESWDDDVFAEESRREPFDEHSEERTEHDVYADEQRPEYTDPIVPDVGNVNCSSQEPLEDDSSETVEHSTPARADLILVLANYQRLQQQLNSDRFTQVVDHFESVLGDILSLYGGEQIGEPHNQNIYCVQFTSSESPSEAAFRAICCAHLIDQLNQQSSIRFNVVSEVCHPDEDVKLAVSQTGVFLQSALLDDLLEKRLKFIPVDERRLRLDGFNPPFASLLERQQQQLTAVV